MDLNVLLLGDGPALPYVAINLALLGVAAGRGSIFVLSKSSPLTPSLFEGQFFFLRDFLGGNQKLPLSEAVMRGIRHWNPSVKVQLIDEIDQYPYDAIIAVPGAEPLTVPDNKPVIYAGVTQYGFYVGAQKPKATGPFLPNILTPSLSSACGAVASQELLRITRSIRVSEIQRFWLSLNYSFYSSAGVSDEKRRFSLGGFQIRSFKDSVNEPTPIHRVPLDLSSDYAKILLGSVDVVEETPFLFHSPVRCFYYSPFFGNILENGEVIERAISIPTIIENKEIILGGLGGLGSWIAALLAVSSFKGKLVLFDSDTQVEEHNLNRMILYNDKAVGLEKASAAREALQRLNPSVTVSAFSHHVVPLTAFTRNLVMVHADLAIAAFDNFEARYVLGQWAAYNGVPLVNGGAERFVGDVEVIRPERSGCLSCVWERELGINVAQSMSSSAEPVSCTREDPNSPDIGTAVVTTIAVVASLQALLSVIVLTLPEFLYDHALGYFAKDNAIEKCRQKVQDTDGRCSLHEGGPCGHPKEFFDKVYQSLGKIVEDG